MLQIVMTAMEYFDKSEQKFVYGKEQTLRLAYYMDEKMTL